MTAIINESISPNYLFIMYMKKKKKANNGVTNGETNGEQSVASILFWLLEILKNSYLSSQKRSTMLEGKLS